MAQHGKTKTYQDATTGQQVELDPNDPSTVDRITRGELTEMTSGQNAGQQTTQRQSPNR